MGSHSHYADADATYRLVRWSDGARALPASPWQAAHVLRNWASCPFGRTSLRRALFDLDALGDASAEVDLAALAVHALERGSVRMLREPRSSPRLTPPDPDPKDDPSGETETKTHDLNFTFQYPDGTPAGGYAYRFIDLEEKQTDGTLGDDGILEKRSVPEGTYRVELKEVLSVRFDETTARCGDEVEVVARVSAFDDGTAARLRLFREHLEQAEQVVDELDASVKAGLVRCRFRYDYAKNEIRAAQQGVARFVAEVSFDDGKIWGKTAEPVAVQLKTLRNVRWSARRVAPAFDAEVTAVAQGYPEGTEVCFELLGNHPIEGPVSLTTLSAPIVAERASARFSFMPSADASAPAFESGRIQHAGEYFVIVSVEDDVSRAARTDILICDPQPAPTSAARS